MARGRIARAAGEELTDQVSGTSLVDDEVAGTSAADEAALDSILEGHAIRVPAEHSLRWP